MNSSLQKKFILSSIAGAAAIAMTVAAAPLAMASSENQTGFTAHYQHNAQIEANLLQKAEASSVTSPTIDALKSTVTNINQQVTVLYGAEQALAGARATIPTSGNGPALRKQHNKLMNEQHKQEAVIRQYRHDKHTNKDKVLLKNAEMQLVVLKKELQEVAFELKHSVDFSSSWKVHPYNGGLGELQTSIYHLQASAIHYTSLWINLENSTVTPVATSITGLSYTSADVAIPAAGATAVSDAVAAQPTVKDQAGNIIPNSGVYSLAGPSGFSGVAIDQNSGTVSVQAGATAGTYTVTYTQGSLTEAVTLNVAAAAAAH